MRIYRGRRLPIRIETMCLVVVDTHNWQNRHLEYISEAMIVVVQIVYLSHYCNYISQFSTHRRVDKSLTTSRLSKGK